MITNNQIDFLCVKLAEQGFDAEAIAARIKTTRLAQQSLFPTMWDYRKYVSETWLHISLENIARSNPSLDLRVGPPDFPYRGQYDVEYRFGNLYVRKKNGAPKNSAKGNEFEYDGIATTKGVTVVFEVKLARLKEEGQHVSSIPRGKIISNLVESIYISRLKPIRSLLGSDFSYVMIIPKDAYNHLEGNQFTHLDPDGLYLAFKYKRGKVVPFCMDIKELEEAVCRTVRDYNLPLRE